MQAHEAEQTSVCSVSIWYTQVPRKAWRVDRKIRAVFVSGAGNTGANGMLTASTQPANYVDLHKPVNNLNLYADSSALPRPVLSVGFLPHCLGNEGRTSRPCASSQVGVSPTSPLKQYTSKFCQQIHVDGVDSRYTGEYLVSINDACH